MIVQRLIHWFFQFPSSELNLGTITKKILSGRAFKSFMLFMVQKPVGRADWTSPKKSPLDEPPCSPILHGRNSSGRSFQNFPPSWWKTPVDDPLAWISHGIARGPRSGAESTTQKSPWFQPWEPVARRSSVLKGRRNREHAERLSSHSNHRFRHPFRMLFVENTGSRG